MIPTAEELMACWNAHRGGMLEAKSMGIRGRTAAAQARLRTVPDLNRWREAIIRASKSRFCVGTLSDTDTWVGNIDWLLKPETLTLIEEGKYDNRGVEAPEPKAAAQITGHFDAHKEFSKLNAEEYRRLRIAGLAIRAWLLKYKIIYPKHGMGEVLDWAWRAGEPPDVVKEYGPPLDTKIEVLENWMLKKGTPWLIVEK